MIALFFALAVQAAAPPVKVTEQEIVVTARRLKDWRGRASAGAKGIRCKTIKTTGDRDLDQIACDSMRSCMGRFTPEVVAASKLMRAARDARMQDINQRLAACGEEQQKLRVADLLDRRAFARTNHAAH